MSYRVILAGTVAAGADSAEVRRKFIAATRQPEAAAIRLLSGTPNVIKRNLSQVEAERIVGLLNGIGAIASMELEDDALSIDMIDVDPVAERPPAASAQTVVPAYIAERGASAPEARAGLTDEAMYRAIVGPKNTDYYLRYFARRDAGGSFLSWNWPCALIQFWWALYRKCYGFAFGGLVLTLLFGGIAGGIYGGIVGAMGGNVDTIGGSAQFVGWIAGFLVGAFGNGFYHRKARKLIRDTAYLSDSNARIAELARRGGTSAVWLWILLGVIVLGILAAIAIPAYQDYTNRARARAVTAEREATPPSFLHDGALKMKLVQKPVDRLGPQPAAA